MKVINLCFIYYLINCLTYYIYLATKKTNKIHGGHVNITKKNKLISLSVYRGNNILYIFFHTLLTSLFLLILRKLIK